MAVATTPNGRDLYLGLVQRFPLRRLRSDAELDRAIAIVDELVTRGDLTAGEEDYLDVLSDLVHKYESSEHPIAPASDAEVLRYLMDSRGLNQVQLAKETGIHVSTISEVLANHRGLSRHNIGVLSRYFSVSPAVFRFE
jgi:HTH-type transcriptional regulator/antitoxin HigA